MTPFSAMRLRANTPSLEAQVAAILQPFSGAKLWYDPSDVSTLWQDSVGTTPVLSTADPIGLIADKSGAGNHATQATTPSRPLWQSTYAAFDGVNRSWATSSIDFTATNKLTVIVGLRKNSDSAVGMVAELSANANSNAGTFFVAAPNAAGTLSFYSRGANPGLSVNTSAAAPVSAVLTGIADIAAPSSVLRRDGVVAASNTGSTGGGNFGNYPLYIGRRAGATLPFNGNLYGLIIIGRLLTSDELSVCERFMARKTGIVLP